MKDIVAYLRVSTEAQDFERQRVDIDNWCRINEWKLNNTFTDKLSGFVEEREGLSELKEYLITNNIKNVIVWELSRLGRDKFNLMTLFKWFVDNQINIFFYTQNFWLLDVNGNLSSNVSLQIMILSNYAETEALMIKERMKSGKERAKKEGRWVHGAVAIGYKLSDDKRVYIDEENAKYVRQAFQLYANGDTSIKQLAVYCIKNNFPSSFGNYQSLRFILKNMIYTGQLNYVNIPAIIDIELYMKVQSIMEEKHTNKNKEYNNNKFLLEKLVTCPKCGAKYGGGGGHRYSCVNRVSSSAKVKCKSSSFDVRVLDAIVWYITKQIAAAQELYVQSNEEQIKDFGQQKELLNNKLETLEKKKKKQNTKFDLDAISIDEYKVIIKNLNSQINLIKNEIESLNIKINQSNFEMQNNNRATRVANNMDALNKLRDLETMRNLMKIIFKSIHVYKYHNNFNIIELETRMNYIYCFYNSHSSRNKTFTTNIALKQCWDDENKLLNDKNIDAEFYRDGIPIEIISDYKYKVKSQETIDKKRAQARERERRYRENRREEYNKHARELRHKRNELKKEAEERRNNISISKPKSKPD